MITVGILPVVWLALLLAPYLSQGILFHLEEVTQALNHPFQINLVENSFRTVFLFLLAYAIGILIYLSNRKNYRRGEEHGSAQWGSIRQIHKKYASTKPSADKILTQNVRISYDGRKHRRNLLTLICGGSGAGKTRFFALPNLFQCNTSFVVLDPNGKEVLGYILQAVH